MGLDGAGITEQGRVETRAATSAGSTGSSGPRILELRCKVALGFDERGVDSLVVVEGFLEICFVVRRSLGFGGDTATEGAAGGVGEAGLTRGFFARLLRIFSSSSDEVVMSERFE